MEKEKNAKKKKAKRGYLLPPLSDLVLSLVCKFLGRRREKTFPIPSHPVHPSHPIPSS
jgi:hypothetical protein